MQCTSALRDEVPKWLGHDEHGEIKSLKIEKNENFNDNAAVNGQWLMVNGQWFEEPSARLAFRLPATYYVNQEPLLASKERLLVIVYWLLVIVRLSLVVFLQQVTRLACRTPAFVRTLSARADVCCEVRELLKLNF